MKYLNSGLLRIITGWTIGQFLRIFRIYRRNTNCLVDLFSSFGFEDTFQNILLGFPEMVVKRR